MKKTTRKVALSPGIIALFLLAASLPIKALISSPPKSGPAAQWATQLSVAQQKVAEIDNQAVLEQVEASFEGIPVAEQTVTSTLVVRFGFVRPSGRHIWVQLLDTDPASSVKVEQIDNSLVGQSTREYLEQLWQQYANIALSPRQALERAWPCSTPIPDWPVFWSGWPDPEPTLNFLPPRRPYTLSRISLDHDVKWDGVPREGAFWAVIYATSNTGGLTYKPDMTTFYVNPRNGETFPLPYPCIRF